jgi:hypothetical protein
MQKLNNLFVSASDRWQRFVIYGLLIIILLGTLIVLNQRFKGITGILIFDTSDTTTTSALLQELFLYRGEGYRFYLPFALLDLIFPIFIATLTALIWAWLLRKNTMPVAQRLLQWCLPLWAFIEVLFDWTENISLLIAVHNGPRRSFLHEIPILAKQFKWLTFELSLLITVTLLALWIINRLTRQTVKSNA